jgi:SAUR family protein
MSAGLGKCNKIRHIVRLRQMLRRWRNKARLSSANRIPSDVPAGHVAVCVGTSCRRFVVRATYLNHPVFKKLLVQAEEEYGFANQGPLAIPCDESLFEEVLRFISRSDSGNSARFANLEDFQRYCHVGVRNNLDFWPESRPLLHAFAEKTIW